MKFDKILLMPNLDKQGSLDCLNAAISKLKKLNMTPLLDRKFASYIPDSECVWDSFDRLLDLCDLILPIGGDGTILRSVGYAITVDKPILGINTGRVGFLTQMEASEMNELARLHENVAVEERMMVEVVVSREKGELQSYIALNDIVFHHEHSKLVDLVVTCGDRLIARHRSSGLIFATPTGSTGYSLSAGGSIADPELSVLLMTAISPYSAYNRSFILPAWQEYTVRMDHGIRSYLSVDGETVAEIQGNETVLARQAVQKAKFVSLGLRDFYSNLYDKLSLRG